MDALGARGDRRQHHIRRRDGEIVAMVFADADEIDADLIGQHAFLDDVAQHLACDSSLPFLSTVTSPNVSSPISILAVASLAWRPLSVGWFLRMGLGKFPARYLGVARYGNQIAISEQTVGKFK